MNQAVQTREVVLFGPFRLVASERLLAKEGSPVDLGGRARRLDRADVSGQHDLWQEGPAGSRLAGRDHWRGQPADSRRRSALGDGEDGARHIATVAGRGYCFVAPVVRTSERAEKPAAAASFPYANLPARPAGMVGLDDDVLELSNQLNAARLVTVVGAGGVGKTTVAVAAGHQLVEDFAGAVLFVDLGMLNDPDLVAMAVAPPPSCSWSTPPRPALAWISAIRRRRSSWPSAESLTAFRSGRERIAPATIEAADCRPPSVRRRLFERALR